MNKIGRGQFLQSGVFDSKNEWLEWLAMLAALGEENEEADDARRLNFLWYTLIKKPEFISHHWQGSRHDSCAPGGYREELDEYMSSYTLL